MTLPIRDQAHHSYAEYLTWAEGTRYELIDGTAYAMSPAPSRLHQRTVFEIARQIADALDGRHCEVYLAPFDVRLDASLDPPDEEVRCVVQPDISVICDQSKLDDRGCRGAPEWVIEVLSPKTAAHDQIAKLALYERHGVGEYWIVHPSDLVLTAYVLKDGVYGRPTVHELKGILASRMLAGVVVDWDRVVGGMP
jgi:Uma2 family endonuclease